MLNTSIDSGTRMTIIITAFRRQQPQRIEQSRGEEDQETGLQEPQVLVGEDIDAPELAHLGLEMRSRDYELEQEQQRRL